MRQFADLLREALSHGDTQGRTQVRGRHLPERLLADLAEQTHGYALEHAAARLSANALGFVLNIQRSLNPSNARAHHAHCRTITGSSPRGTTWTGPYIKACSPSLRELDAWALAQAQSPLEVASRNVKAPICTKRL